MTQAIAAALQLILLVASYLMDKAKVNAETKKKFFDFVKQAGTDTKSQRLLEWGDKQLNQLLTPSTPEKPWQETP